MGFLDGVGRFLSGKPVFQEEVSQATQPAADGNASTASRNGLIDEHGNKVIPKIELTNVRSHRKGDTVMVTAWITNRSDQTVKIHDCHLLKQRQQYQRELGPAGAHEFTLYQGSLPRDEAEHYAEITYSITANGDEFQRRYLIEYYRENDGGILVDELHDDGPVRDI